MQTTEIWIQINTIIVYTQGNNESRANITESTETFHVSPSLVYMTVIYCLLGFYRFERDGGGNKYYIQIDWGLMETSVEQRFEPTWLTERFIIVELHLLHHQRRRSGTRSWRFSWSCSVYYHIITLWSVLMLPSSGPSSPQRPGFSSVFLQIAVNIQSHPWRTLWIYTWEFITWLAGSALFMLHGERGGDLNAESAVLSPGERQRCLHRALVKSLLRETWRPRWTAASLRRSLQFSSDRRDKCEPSFKCRLQELLICSQQVESYLNISILFLRTVCLQVSARWSKGGLRPTNTLQDSFIFKYKQNDVSSVVGQNNKNPYVQRRMKTEQ